MNTHVLLAAPALSLVLRLAVLASPPPNIIVFLTDDQGQLDCSPYGGQGIRTPNMQRLADTGMTFTHAYVASPSCAPSRIAFQSPRRTAWWKPRS